MRQQSTSAAEFADTDAVAAMSKSLQSLDEVNAVIINLVYYHHHHVITICSNQSVAMVAWACFTVSYCDEGIEGQ